MEKTLILCFSATGNTKRVSTMMAEILKADRDDILPEVEYTGSDLNWMDKQSRTTLEMEDRNCRPAIVHKDYHLSQYGNVILAFPIWWYREPSIIDSVLAEYDFSGINIYLLATSGGSGIEGALKHVKELFPTYHFIAGKRLSPNAGEGEIMELGRKLK